MRVVETIFSGLRVRQGRIGGRAAVVVLAGVALTGSVAFATSGKDPADYQTPAAGTCGGVHGQGATLGIDLNPDIPSPRCIIVRPDQHVRITNRRGEAARVFFGGHTSQLGDGDSVRYPQRAGRFLEFGVHVIEIGAGGGSRLGFGEVWLKHRH